MSSTQNDEPKLRQPPVDWSRLKQIQDENPAPRVPGGAVLAVFLLGLCALSFFLAFESALDPEERIEPARYFALAATALGVLAGWAGVMCVLRASRRDSGK